MVVIALVGEIAKLSPKLVDAFREKLSDPRFEAVIVDISESEKIKSVFERVDIIVPIFYGLNDETFDTYKSATRLKLIQIPWVGADPYNFDYAKKLGVKICNSRWNTPIIGEFTMSLLLSSAKFLVPCDKDMRTTHKFTAQSQKSKTIRGSQILFLGAGNIPKEIIRLLRPFGAHITVLRQSLKSGASSEMGPDVKEITWTDYDAAASVADFVICVLPLTPDTKDILDEKKFAAVKKDSIFVNVGRAGVANEEALFNALKSGHLRGAALDVWYSFAEPYKLPFHELDNVILSPYRAWNADDEESLSNFWETTVHNTKAVSEGRLHELKNVMDLDKKY